MELYIGEDLLASASTWMNFVPIPFYARILRLLLLQLDLPDNFHQSTDDC